MAYVVRFSLAVSLGEGARLERIVLLDEPADAVSISYAEVDLQPGARLAQIVIASGADCNAMRPMCAIRAAELTCGWTGCICSTASATPI